MLGTADDSPESVVLMVLYILNPVEQERGSDGKRNYYGTPQPREDMKGFQPVTACAIRYRSAPTPAAAIVTAKPESTSLYFPTAVLPV